LEDSWQPPVYAVWQRLSLLAGWTAGLRGTHRFTVADLQHGGKAEVREELWKHVAVQAGDEATVSLEHLKRPRVIAAAAVWTVLRQCRATVRRGGQHPGAAAFGAWS